MLKKSQRNLLMKHLIYLDNNSTTPVDPLIKQSYCSALDSWANPSSSHYLGRKARQALASSREIVAAALHVSSEEIIFTASATEAINLALQSLFSEVNTAAEVVYSSVEHPAVIETLQFLAKNRRCILRPLPVGKEGFVKVEALEKAVNDKTRLIITMAANNETGIKNDIAAIAALAERHTIPLMVDAVALFGKERFTMPKGVALLCISGHKFHGVVGAAALFIDKSLKLPPFILGGGQERGLRAGTENLPAIAALAQAVSMLDELLPAAQLHMEQLRNDFEEQLKERLCGFVAINGSESLRVVNTSNVLFKGMDGESLLYSLDRAGVAASLGSACSSGSLEPSPVLLNMGLTLQQASSSLRFSFSRMNSQEETARAIEIICREVERLTSV